MNAPLPEHMAHRTNKVQLQFVAVLALIALLTHNNVFWIAALLLALIELPDFSTPMNSIALSLERLSGRDRAGAPPSAARFRKAAWTSPGSAQRPSSSSAGSCRSASGRASQSVLRSR